MRQTVHKLPSLSVIFPGAAILIELFMVPVARLLPEYYSFWSLWVMLTAALFSAVVGVLGGAVEFRKHRARIALAGFLLGEAAFLLILFVSRQRSYVYF